MSEQNSRRNHPFLNKKPKGVSILRSSFRNVRSAQRHHVTPFQFGLYHVVALLRFLRGISLASLFAILSIFGWSDLLQILRKQAAFSFAVFCIIIFLQEFMSKGTNKWLEQPRTTSNLKQWSLYRVIPILRFFISSNGWTLHDDQCQPWFSNLSCFESSKTSHSQKPSL